MRDVVGPGFVGLVFRGVGFGRHFLARWPWVLCTLGAFLVGMGSVSQHGRSHMTYQIVKVEVVRCCGEEQKSMWDVGP